MNCQLHTSNIQDKVRMHAAEILGNSFSFREGQLEAICKIVENSASGIKHTMLEAPTGSGKSIIALLSAYVLYKEFNMKSYILVSDLTLYKQYENDIKKTGSTFFGCIKGKENYICAKNGCKVSQSACSLQRMSVKGMTYKRGSWPCKWTCQYIQDYMQAVQAPITLMTYQFYFIQRNYVEDEIFGGKNPNFPERDLVICDECHKLCEICQAHFAPVISIERPRWMNVLDKYEHIDSYENDRRWIVKSISECTDNDKLVDLVNDYEKYIMEYVEANDRIRNRLAKRNHLTKMEKAALVSGNRARQEHCKIADMQKFIADLKSSEYLVKTLSKDSIVLNFIFDDIMLKKYFHNKSRCELLMSATIGDFNSYASLTGLDKKQCRAIALPSAFDFSKSPIVVSNENFMTYESKKEALPNIAEQAVQICKDNCDVRGIIQTGSYENARALMRAMPDDVRDRCLQYNSTSEKNYMLEEFLRRGKDGLHDNSILVGPTLIEGLDFPDDLCRFQICIKVPYAFLGSEYVQKKMRYVAGWYEYDVLNKICQGIGRGIRHKKDWCKTYILDGCISYLRPKLEKFSALNGRFVMMKHK